jgi:hypothetical protein
MLCLSVANTIVKQNTRIAIFYTTDSQAEDLPKTWSGITNKLANIPPRLQIFMENPPWIGRAGETIFMDVAMS